MGAVAGAKIEQKRRSPQRYEAILIADSRKAAKARVDEQNAPGRIDGDIMSANGAGRIDFARNILAIVAIRSELARRKCVFEPPDLVVG
jgi:hypothetical protein